MLNQEDGRDVRFVVKEFDPMLRMPQVMRAIGLSRATIYRYMDMGLFPQPVQLGINAVGWRLSVIEAWLQSRESR